MLRIYHFQLDKIGFAVKPFDGSQLQVNFQAPYAKKYYYYPV